LKRGAVSYYELRGWWSDAGTQESLLKANQEVRQNMATKLLDILEEMSRK
jgi:dTDP-glucose pyrophosphorylase